MKSFWSANSRDSIRLIALNGAHAIKAFWRTKANTAANSFKEFENEKEYPVYDRGLHTKQAFGVPPKRGKSEF